jgi:hypothetical protein
LVLFQHLLHRLIDHYLKYFVFLELEEEEGKVGTQLFTTHGKWQERRRREKEEKKRGRPEAFRGLLTKHLLKTHIWHNNCYSLTTFIKLYSSLF